MFWCISMPSLTWRQHLVLSHIITFHLFTSHLISLHMQPSFIQCMRPSYQKYHEVRGELDVLQSSIEKKYGLIPLFTEEALDPDKSGGVINSTSTSSRTAGEGAGTGAGTGSGTGAGTGSRSIRAGDTSNPLVVTPYLAPSPAEFLSLGVPNRVLGAGQGQGQGQGQGVLGTGGVGVGGGELFSSCLFKGTGTSPQSNGPVPPIGRWLFLILNFFLFFFFPILFTLFFQFPTHDIIFLSLCYSRIEVEQDLKKLQAEITDLHMFLKTYERWERKDSDVYFSIAIPIPCNFPCSAITSTFFIFPHSFVFFFFYASPIIVYPILSNPILSYPIPSYPVLPSQSIDSYFVIPTLSLHSFFILPTLTLPFFHSFYLSNENIPIGILTYSTVDLWCHMTTSSQWLQSTYVTRLVRTDLHTT